MAMSSPKMITFGVQKNPHEFVKRGVHTEKINIWCEILRKTFGLFFFETTSNTVRY